MKNKILILLVFLIYSCSPYYHYRLEKAKNNAIALDLSAFPDKNLPEKIYNFSKLKSINLSKNKYQFVEQSLNKLAKLESIESLILNDIEDINIETIFISLKKFKKLKYLSLGNNKITLLPNTISDLNNLESIYLNQNSNIKIKPLINQLSSLKKLKILFMKNCNLTFLPNEILSFEKLTTLNLYGNKLSKLPNINELKNLNSIDIGNNKFSEIPSVIYKFKKRINLYLNKNLIEEISERDIVNVKFQTFNIKANPLSNTAKDIIMSKVNARYKWY